MTARLADFERLQELGAGHFGRVWLAEGPVTPRRGGPPKRRRVAIKELRAGATADARRRLAQEFALLDQVKHRSVVRVFQYLPDDDAVVMELVEGATLRRVLDDCAARGEPLYGEAALEIACELADALFQAWTTPGDDGEPLRLVHRDLKPENVMLTPGGEVKILDFGLARATAPEVVPEDRGRARGTPIYMAPEQARGEEVDHRSDLYAVGLLLYEMLVGRPAWQVPEGPGDPVRAVLERVAGGQLDDACRDVEARLGPPGSIVARLLQPRARNRYQTGQDLLVDLRRLLYREPGAYLREFCSFYFGTVHPLAPPAVPPPGVAAMPDQPDRPHPPPSGARPRPRVIQKAGLPARVEPTPEEDAWEPPSVKGGSTPRQVGARSPDETGMLPLQSLGGGGEGLPGASADPSATQFFAIPMPKAERPKAANPPPFVPPAPGATPMAPAAPPPEIGVGAAARPAAGGFQGPVGGITGPTPDRPFDRGAPVDDGPGAGDGRVQSWRVAAVLLALFAFVVMLFLSLLAVWYFGLQRESEPAPVVPAATPPVAAAPVPTPVAEPEPAPVAPASARKPATPRKPSTGTSAAAPAPAAPAVEKGTATVTFRMDPTPTNVRLTCPDGTTRNVGVSGGKATLTNVDAAEGCSIRPYGPGVVSTSTRVVGGRSYTCDLVGGTLQCK